MKSITLILTDEELWTLNVWRNQLGNSEKKSKSPEGQKQIALANKILKAAEKESK